MNLRKYAAIPGLAVTLAAPASAAEWAVGANIGNVPWEFRNAQDRLIKALDEAMP